MNEIKIIERDPLYVVSKSSVNPKTIRAGKLIVWSFLLMVFIGLIQALYTFENKFRFLKLETSSLFIYFVGYCYWILPCPNLR